MTDPRVKAIREHPLVGRGSCSVVDECYSDEDLLRHFDDGDFWRFENVETPLEALTWAIERETMHRESALNTRWGEDSDPELKAWNDWKAKVIEAGFKDLVE